MQLADGVRQIHRPTHRVTIYRKTWVGRPQVPETLEQKLLVNLFYACLTPQKLDQRRRIVTEVMRVADAQSENKLQPPQESLRLCTLLVRRLFMGHRRP